jgi:hypothetical protein
VDEKVMFLALAFAALVAIITRTVLAQKLKAKQNYIRRGIRRLQHFINKE